MARAALVLLSLAACGSSAPATTTPTPAAAPAAPAAPAVAIEPLPADPAAARAELALRFIRAVAARDRARIDAIVDVRGFCTAGFALMKDKEFASIDACVDEIGKANQPVFAIYEQDIAAGSEPGAADEYAIDADQGIYQMSVHVAGSEHGVVGVFVVTLDGRPFVVFPVKKGE